MLRKTTACRIMTLHRRQIPILEILLIAFLFLPDVVQSFTSRKVTWSVTELLINFHGGFVRRGLVGQIILPICTSTGLSPFIVIGTLFLITTIVVVAAMLWLLQPYRQRFSVLTILLLFSPALLMFPVHEYAAYARKEVFVVIGLLVHAIAARRFADGDISVGGMRRFYLLGLLPMLTLFTFIHEVQLFFLPAHAGMMFLGAWQRRVNFLWLFLIFLPPAAVAMLMLRYPGNADMIPGIVESLKPIITIQPGREGAIEGLGWPLAHFTDLASRTRNDPSTMMLYTIAWFLAVAVPTALLGRVAIRYAPPDDKPLMRRIIVFVLLICIAPLPLYILGADFGRWIYLTAFSMVTLLLSLPVHLPAPEPDEIAPPRSWPRVLAIVLAGVYICGWTLPHYGTAPPVLKSGMARSIWRTTMMLAGKDPYELQRERRESTMAQ